jgi:hypothetical protein
MDSFKNKFIKVKDLKKLLDDIDDDDFITISQGNTSPNSKIIGITDSTCVGFWELRIET